MRFNWYEYFDLAKELADTNLINSEDSANNAKSKIFEAKLRSSISRSYYGAFCIARNYLRDILCDTRLSRARSGDINEHQYVAEEFKHNNVKNRKMIEVGNDLGRLRQLRNKADYEDNMYNLEKEVKLALKLAENIIAKIAELIEEATK